MQAIAKSSYLVLIALFSIHIVAPSSVACSLPPRVIGPFLSRGVLPRNARGILYYRSAEFMLDGDSELGLILVNDLPSAPHAGQFRISDLTADRMLTPVVLQLADSPPDRLSSYRYLRYKDRSLARCTISETSERCRELKRLQRESGKSWVHILFLENELEDVTDQAKQLFGLFRIEPAEGFLPGHRYKFWFHDDHRTGRLGASRDEGEITIHETADIEREHMKTRPIFDGRQRRRPLNSAGVSNRLVDVRQVRLPASPALVPFNDSLLVTWALSNEDAQLYSPWEYPSPRPGLVRSETRETGIGGVLLYASCSQTRPQDGLIRAQPHTLKAYLGFFEVFDDWIETESLSVTFPPLEPGGCSAEEQSEQQSDGPDGEAKTR